MSDELLGKFFHIKFDEKQILNYITIEFNHEGQRKEYNLELDKFYYEFIPDRQYIAHVKKDFRGKVVIEVNLVYEEPQLQLEYKDIL